MNKGLFLSLIVVMFLCISVSSASEISTQDVTVIDDVSSSIDDKNIVSDLSVDNDDKTNLTLNASDVQGYYGLKKSFSVSVKGQNGENVNSGNLTFYNLLGKNYTVDVIDSKAELNNIPMNQTGNYTIACFYSGSDEFNSALTSFKLKIPILTPVNHNFCGTKYRNIIYFSGNLLNDFEEEIIEGNLTFYNGNKLLGTCDVDYNGNFLFIWNLTEDITGKKVYIHADYTDKLGNYNSCNDVLNKTFIFNKSLDTKVLFDVNKKSDGSYYVNGTVIDENGKPILGGNAEVVLDGKTYIIPVGSDGKFAFSINNNVKKPKYEFTVYDWGAKADVTANIPLMNIIEHTELTDKIIDLCKQGTPVIKFGNGNGPTVIINAGTHGEELASQAAAFKLLNLLANYGDEIKGTIYVIPILFPNTTADNVRVYNGIDPNRVANVNGSISNHLVNFAVDLNVDALGDFHCTRHSDLDVGITCAMCSLKPTYESYLIAKYISKKTGYYLDIYNEAGVPYAGAVEDYANIRGIPAVTCEALTNHKNVEYGSVELSFIMMKAFLDYFGFNVDDMIDIPLPTKNGTYDLTIKYLGEYNYNPSEATLKKVIIIGKDTPSPNPKNDANKTSKGIPMEHTGNPLVVLLFTLICLPLLYRKK